jgi:phosphoribosylaminoimidazolecarboxamide formyltransferase/IMP cyclohydrolase
MKKIQNALITVYNKEKLNVIATKLQQLNINIYSTGGTYDYLQRLGIPATTVENLTGYPAIFGGRVKTLHPVVMGGILHRRKNHDDIKQVEQYHIPPIDLVIVDLYPFEETLKQTNREEEIIEKIDIGGISLIRSAAKNFEDVLCIPSREYYQQLINILTSGNGMTSPEQRRQFACYSFKVSSRYDRAIYNWFAGETPLRYGENPHQSAVFHGKIDDCFEQLNGKEISYNNLLDIDAAVSLINDFGKYTFAIIKHNNACGIATRNNLLEAWRDALAGDPVSAFGGVLICNGEIKTSIAQEINKLFFEVLIAPDYKPEALEILKSKKNRILLRQKNLHLPPKQFRSLLTGVIEQERDTSIENQDTLRYPTQQRPTIIQLKDLFYANRIVKHTKSNAIVLVKNQQLLASGMGQTSRVDALNHAIAKAKHFNMNLHGAVMASDAFFPFKDCVEIAAKEGITSIIQPGGSLRDQESIDACDNKGVSMVFTGVRHFKH